MDSGFGANNIIRTFDAALFASFAEGMGAMAFHSRSALLIDMYREIQNALMFLKMIICLGCCVCNAVGRYINVLHVFIHIYMQGVPFEVRLMSSKNIHIYLPTLYCSWSEEPSMIYLL